MGFRCPFCKADFGRDKEAFDRHMKEENQSVSIEGLAATNLADTLKKALGPTEGQMEDACQNTAE